jgi:hypothetical protein
LRFSNEIRISSGVSTLFRNPEGNEILISIPSNTKNINILVPLNERNEAGKIKDDTRDKYLKMINIE